MSFKRESRIIGVDDGPFDRFTDTAVPVIGTITRGSRIEGFLHTEVTVDGMDATNALVEMITRSRFATIIRCIMLDGIALAGFNVIDVRELSQKTALPVIVVMRRAPDLEAMRIALDKMGHPGRYTLLEKAGHIREIMGLHIQSFGIDEDDIGDILRMTQVEGNVPEPIRISHMVAGALRQGESKGCHQ